MRDEIEALLVAVERREVTPSDALEQLSALPFLDLGFARVDTHRELRQGAPEAVLGEGKTPGQVAGIVSAMLSAVLPTSIGRTVCGSVHCSQTEANRRARSASSR